MCSDAAKWAVWAMGSQVTEVQKSLKGFDYPGSLDQLAQHAEDNGADTDLVEALREDVLTQSETLAEDDMGVDPLEGGMDPAEDWSASNRYGTTATEQATDRPLTERLEEERPDVSTTPVPDRPVAATPLEELDESVDEEVTPRER
ncbi:MAG: DUF2795 domain-containing protein [Pseudonocardiaceae bacterium]